MPHDCPNEQRLKKLEEKMIEHNFEIKALLGKLDNMTSWLKALVFTLLPLVLSAFVYLIGFWVKGV